MLSRAQLGDRLLPTLQVRGLNPVIGKSYILMGNGPFKRLMLLNFMVL